MHVEAAAGPRDDRSAADDDPEDRPGVHEHERGQSRTAPAAPPIAADPERDETLQHPRCVFQVLKRHFARYTPELVARDLRHPAGAVPAGRRRADARTRAASAPARSATRWAGPTTRWARSTSAPRRSCRRCWATSAGPAAASWRCAGTPASRAPPTSRRCSTCCPATSRCRTRTASRTCDTFIEADTGDKGFWGNMRRLHGQPAQGLVGRRRDAGQRLLLRLPAPAHRRPLHVRHRAGPDRRRRARATSWSARTRRWARPTPSQQRVGLANLDWLVVRDLQHDRDGHVLEGRPGDRDRGAAHRGHRHRGVLPARRRAHREGRHASPTPSGCCSGTTRRSSRPATAAATCGSTTTSAGGSRQRLAGSAEPRDRPCWT